MKRDRRTDRTPARASFTDPEARVTRRNGGFRPGMNVQAATAGDLRERHLDRRGEPARDFFVAFCVPGTGGARLERGGLEDVNARGHVSCE